MSPENVISAQVLDASIRVHRAFGPGLFESVYERALAFELQKRGLEVTRQEPVAVRYEGIELPHAFRTDLMVARLVIVEVKSVERLEDVHLKQTLTYVRLAGLRLGLLINFNCRLLKHGFKRIVHGLPEE